MVSRDGELNLGERLLVQPRVEEAEHVAVGLLRCEVTAQGAGRVRVIPVVAECSPEGDAVVFGEGVEQVGDPVDRVELRTVGAEKLHGSHPIVDARIEARQLCLRLLMAA